MIALPVAPELAPGCVERVMPAERNPAPLATKISERDIGKPAWRRFYSRDIATGRRRISTIIIDHRQAFSPGLKIQMRIAPRPPSRCETHRITKRMSNTLASRTINNCREPNRSFSHGFKIPDPLEPPPQTQSKTLPISLLDEHL